MTSSLSCARSSTTRTSWTNSFPWRRFCSKLALSTSHVWKKLFQRWGDSSRKLLRTRRLSTDRASACESSSLLTPRSPACRPQALGRREEIRYEKRDSATRHAGFMVDVCINLHSVAEGAGASYQA